MKSVQKLARVHVSGECSQQEKHEFSIKFVARARVIVDDVTKHPRRRLPKQKFQIFLSHLSETPHDTS